MGGTVRARSFDFLDFDGMKFAADSPLFGNEKDGWKLERNIVTGHCRIINPEKIRVAWGDYSRMKMAFKKVVSQLVLPAAKHSAEH